MVVGQTLPFEALIDERIRQHKIAEPEGGEHHLAEGATLSPPLKPV
jgi:hypothetical protein